MKLFSIRLNDLRKRPILLYTILKTIPTHICNAIVKWFVGKVEGVSENRRDFVEKKNYSHCKCNSCPTAFLKLRGILKMVSPKYHPRSISNLSFGEPSYRKECFKGEKRKRIVLRPIAFPFIIYNRKTPSNVSQI